MRILFITLSCFLACASLAQVKMRDVLKKMPEALVPYLKENARLDFIDFIDSGMRAEVNNGLEGKSELTKLTDVYVSIKLTKASQLDMRLLDVNTPVNDAKQIVCLVQTYGSDIRESTISFYTTDWKLLDASERVELPQEMLLLTLGDEEPTLIATPECRLDAPANDEQKMMEKPSKTFKWDGEKFNKY